MFYRITIELICFRTYAVPLYMVSKIIIFKILLLYIVPLRKSCCLICWLEIVMIIHVSFCTTDWSAEFGLEYSRPSLKGELIKTVACYQNIKQRASAIILLHWLFLCQIKKLLFPIFWVKRRSQPLNEFWFLVGGL